jgi:AraC-like DNA-binding protein
VEWDWPIHPGLAGLVERFVGYSYVLDPASVHHASPGPVATVIVCFQAPLDIAWPTEPGSRTSQWCLASGLHTRPALIRTHGGQHGIQLGLTPLGCRVLLGTPLAELAHALAGHADLPHGIPEALHDELAGEPSWPRRLARLERHLLAAARASRADVADDLARGWAMLGQRGGRVRTAELARELGWSRRNLLTRFRAEFGLPPSELARIHRLGTAMGLARAGGRWAQVAADAGYADQAHLIREFVAMAGQTPTQWRADAFPVVQDADGPRPSRSSS